MPFREVVLLIINKVFEGSVSEGKTLQGMLEKLNAPKGALVVMDTGIATGLIPRLS
jgi:hypothetical protein